MILPPCGLWPASPPRKNLYAEDNLLVHPLVSVFAAPDWKGSCPIFIETGTELLSDEDKYLATVAAKQDVPVVFEEYEAMPHCFAMVLRELAGSRRAFEGWAGFIRKAVEEPESVKTSATMIRAKSLREEVIDIRTLSRMEITDVKRRMKERVDAMTPQKPDMLGKVGSKL